MKQNGNKTCERVPNRSRIAGSHERRGYAAFIDRGSGWEQCTCEVSRDTARIYVRVRRQQEKSYPMGKRFKTDKVRRPNAAGEPPATKTHGQH